MKSIHMGFGVLGLRQLIEEGAVKPHVLLVDGKELGSRAEAIAHLASLSARGRTTISACPTPDAQGRCPGHERQEE